MLVRLAILALLNPALASISTPDTDIVPIAESVDCANRDMEVGRYYLSKSNLIGALGVFRRVIKDCPTTLEAEEALAHLTKIYLSLDISSEAQTAVAVLERKFPSGRWTIIARDALRSAGLEPLENEKSWVARPFR
jgi:outer membrane protein assembly factor BamD